MWECGFEETPLLLIPRGERNRAEGGGSCGQQRFHSGSQQDGHAWGGPSRARAAQGSLCPSGAPADSPSKMLDILHPPGVTAECPHYRSGCCTPTMRQFAAPAQLPANSSFISKRNKLTQM